MYDSCLRNVWPSQARLRCIQVRKQLVQLVDKLLSLLHLWAPCEMPRPPSDATSGDVHGPGAGGEGEETAYAAHIRIASSLVRRELYVSFLALVGFLAGDGQGGAKNVQVCWGYGFVDNPTRYALLGSSMAVRRHNTLRAQ